MINFKSKLSKYNFKIKYIGGSAGAETPGAGAETPDQVFQRLSNLSRPPTLQDIQLLDQIVKSIQESEEYLTAEREYNDVVRLISKTPDSDPSKKAYREDRDKKYKVVQVLRKKLEDLIMLHSMLEANVQSNTVPMTSEQIENQRLEYQRQEQEYEQQREAANQAYLVRQAEEARHAEEARQAEAARLLEENKQKYPDCFNSTNGLTTR